jgi:hypothetical protein
MITNEILRPLQFLKWICSGFAAIFLGSGMLLFGPQLQAQDLLLKEYIYLDGRLLAVERQMVTLVAQQPAIGPDITTKMAFACSPSKSSESILPEGNRHTAASGTESAPMIGSVRSPAFAGFLNPDDGQKRFVIDEKFTLRLDAYRWNWRISEILGHKNGGNHEGL